MRCAVLEGPSKRHRIIVAGALCVDIGHELNEFVSVNLSEAFHSAPLLLPDPGSRCGRAYSAETRGSGARLYVVAVGSAQARGFVS